MVVGSGVHGGAVDQEPQCGTEVTPGSLAALTLASEAAVDVGESCADAVLVLFEGVQVDGVGEVGFEELVRFGFEPPLSCVPPHRHGVGVVVVRSVMVWDRSARRSSKAASTRCASCA